MLSERALYLLNAGIDGELDATEQEELDAVLEASAEARAMHAELLKLANLLESVPAKDPPPELSAQILDRVATPRPQKRRVFRVFRAFRHRVGNPPHRGEKAVRTGGNLMQSR